MSIPTLHPATTRWTPTPVFMVRVAGLPVDAVEPLCQPATVRWAREVLATERALDTSGSRIADLIRDAVGANGDDGRRHRLIALRRDIHNRRAPRDPAAARDLADRLPDPLGPLVAGWLDDRARYAALLSAGAACLAAELDAGRTHLRSLAADPRLRYGLVLSSPSLDRHLSTYLDAPPGRPGKRARRLERSLLEYVYRTACKTSPFSTLTTVAVGHLADTGDGSVRPRASLDAGWRSHTRLNVAALARLSRIMMEDADLRRDLPVRLTSGLRSGADRVRYVRRVLSAGDGTHEVVAVQQNLFYLSQGTLLQDVIDIVGAAGELRYADLVERLRAVAPADRDRAHLDVYLHHLLRLSLLTSPLLRVDIHHPDPVAAFAGGLVRLDRPWSARLAARLDTIGGLVRHYPDADLDGRRATLDRLRAELDGAQTDLGVAKPSGPQNILYEDVSVPDAGATADRSAWRTRLLPSLSQVARLLPVFDLLLAHRIGLKGFFVARFGRGGRCDDVLRLVHEFHRDYYGPYLRYTGGRPQFDGRGVQVRDPNWLRLPEVDALGDARGELIRRMARLRTAAGDAEEVVLDDTFVGAVAAHVPTSQLALRPHSFFLQIADRPDGPLGVVNRCYSGLTLMFSRFLHCFDDGSGAGLVTELRDELTRLRPEGAVFAEITGGYDTTNLNLHPALTTHELVCPGDVSFRPAAEQVPIDDLAVVHDEATDRLMLRSVSLGVEVVPLYLGFLMPLALPEVHRTMLLFSPTTIARPDMWGGTAVDTVDADDAVRYRPRIRLDDVVLDRRTWLVHPAAFPPPRSETGDGDAGWFLGWQRFRARYRLPRRVFATLDRTPFAGANPDAGATFTMKPQYVDFDSAFSVGLLEAAARPGDRGVTLTEMLPDTGETWLRSADGGHVAELTVEITGTAEGERR